MMQRTILVTFVIIFGTSLARLPEGDMKYRDYEYNPKTAAFYKLHIEEARYQQAKDTCSLEGASLMVPSSNEDVGQVHAMLKRFPDIGDFVYVGDDGQKHESAEETPLIDLKSSSEETRSFRFENCEVVTRRGEIDTTHCYHRYPFICKVGVTEAPYDAQCGGVYATGYKYYDSVKSCYKVPPLPLTWNEAYSECQHEGAHLVVLNSATESDTVKEFLKTAPRVVDAKTSYFFFAGIRANRPTDGSSRVFKTIFNETLEEAGFNLWSDGEPNNYQDSEYCGSVFSNNGKYNDVDCSHRYSFVCEKEVTRQ